MHSFVISLYFSPTYTIDYAAKTLLLNTPLKESSTVSFVNHYYIFSNFTTYYYKTNKFIKITVDSFIICRFRFTTSWIIKAPSWKQQVSKSALSTWGRPNKISSSFYSLTSFIHLTSVRAQVNPGLWIRNIWMRIRIQLFTLMQIRDPTFYTLAFVWGCVVVGVPVRTTGEKA
jgi:hypothetical protein